MLAALSLACVLSAPPTVGYATVYGFPGDRWDDGRVACERRVRARLRARGREAEWPAVLEMGTAHRDLPCGTRLLVWRPVRDRWGRVISVRRAVVTVVDRGPYGRDFAGHWRGILDLRPATARTLGVTRDVVLFRVIGG